MTATILRGFLDLTQINLVFALFLSIFYLYSSRAASRLMLIFLFSMLLNAILKYYFAVPLPPHLQPGWAFPSGHMQAACVLWLWLCWEIKHLWLNCLALFILTGIGCGLVYFGYHTPFDVVGAIFFSAMILSGYQFILSRLTPPLAILGLVFASMGLGIIYLIPISFNHLWLAFGALLGFSLGQLGQPADIAKYPAKLKLISFTITLLFFIGLFKFSPFASLYKPYALALSYSLLGLSLMLIPRHMARYRIDNLGLAD